MARVGLQARILRAFGLLLSGVVLGSLLLVHRHATSQIQVTAREELETSRRVFEELLTQRARSLIAAATAVGELPVAREAARTWAPDRLERAFREINRLVGSEVVILTDRMGLILARSDRGWEIGETFSETTSVARALRGERASSLWVQSGRLYQIVSVPLRLPTGLAGTLSVGFRVDRALAEELARLGGHDVAFVVAGSIVAASRTLEPIERETIATLVGAIHGSDPIYGSVDLGSELPAIVVAPFLGLGAERLGAYAILRSLRQETEGLSALDRRLAAIAIVALFATLAVGYLVSRSLSRPLSELAVAAHELGEGNYDSRIPPGAGSQEVVELTTAFERMRGSLRHRIEDLHDLNARLEDLVGERTAALEAALGENRRLLEALREANEDLERRVEARSQELARAQDLLIRQDRMVAVGRLAAGIAHEVNNPLAVLSGFAEGLLDRAENPALQEVPQFSDFPEGLRVIVEEVERLRAIVQKFLNFSRSRAPQKSLFDVNDIARQVLDLIGTHARQQGKALTGDLSGPPITVEADQEQIRQVLLNLVLNGLDAVDRDGEVRVGTALRHGRAELVVADDGVGIDETIRDRIFEPFFTTKPPEKGTGLGLALCHDLVRENGGTLSVETPASGRGTTFVVVLDAVTNEALASHA